LQRLQTGGQLRSNELAAWCQADVTMAVFDRGTYEYNPDDAAHIRPRAAFAWLRTPGLDPRVLYTWRGVDVIAMQPCRALPHRQ
jgi:hypothetical protein